MREPTQEEVDAWEQLQVDITNHNHWEWDCCPEVCGGTSYDPCKDAREEEW